MDKQTRKQVITLSVVGLALVGALAYAFLTSPSSKKGVAPKAPGAQTASAEKAEEVFRVVDVDPTQMLQIVTFKPQKYTRGRNPLEATPLTSGEATVGGIEISNDVVRDKIKNVKEKSVSAIIFDNVRPMAIIDDEIVELGYVYPDGVVKIHAIEPDKVIFEVEQMLVPVDMKEL